MWQNLIKLFSFLVSLEGIFSRQLNECNNIYWQIFWDNVSQQMNVGIEEMNVRCKIYCLGRIFETADRLQKIKRKSSKSRRVSSCWNKSFLQPLRWKSTFDFTQIVNNYASKRRMLSRRLKFVFHVSQKLHIQFRKIFHSVLLCSVGSDYCKKVGC